MADETKDPLDPVLVQPVEPKPAEDNPFMPVAAKQDERPMTVSKPTEAKPEPKPVQAVVDKPDGPKEHFEAIHFLIDQMLNVPKQSGATIDSLKKIIWRLELIEEKPEAVAAEKKRQEEIQKAANEAKAKEDAKAKAEAKAKSEAPV